MNRIILFGGIGLGLSLAGGAAAQTMPLRTVLEKGTSLEKKGPLAVFSMGEVKLLQKEITATVPILRAERLAAVKAGRKPAYCPPEKGEPMGAKQLLADLRSVAPGLGSNATVTDGMRAMLARKYPCR